MEEYLGVRGEQGGNKAGSAGLNRHGRMAAAALISWGAGLAVVDNPSFAVLGLVLWLNGLCLALGAAWLWPSRVSRSRGPRELLAGIPLAEIGVAAGLSVLGAGARLYDLASFPSGVHGDEGEFALIAAAIWQGRGPNPFGTAFLGDPALFMYFDAPFVGLLGHTVEGMRAFGALSGALTLPVFYLLARDLLGPRAALVALALLAGNAAHVHFSRMALNIPQTALLACAAFYALRRSEAGDRPFWWLIAGVLGALAFYFHFVGRLVPVVMVLYWLFLLAGERDQWRRWLRGAALSGSGAALAWSPMAVHLWSRPNQFMEHMSSRLVFNDSPRLTQLYGTTDLAPVLWGQLRANLLGFVEMNDRSDFYTFAGAPLLPDVLVPLFWVALTLLAVYLRDRRCALMGFWFGTAVAVGTLTNGPPMHHRLVFAVPAAVLAIALLLDLALGRLLGLRRELVSAMGAAAVVLVPLWAGMADLSHYFGPAAAARPWEPTTAQAYYVARLGPGTYVNALSRPVAYFHHGSTRFLAPKVEGRTLTQDPGAELREPPPAGRDLVFLVYPQQAQHLATIEDLYPGGQREDVHGVRGNLLFMAYLVPVELLGQ